MSKARDLANAGTALGAVTATELGYVDGVTSAIQTQIDSKIGSASAINPTIVDAKGDIVAASGSDTPARLAVGNNGETLVADSSTSTGLRYKEDYAAGKNKIINGDFGVWQRGTTVSASNTYAYLSDRWQSVCDGNFSGSRQTFTPGTAPVAGYEGKYFFRYTKTSGTYWQVQQPIEDVQTLAGQTATISFWAKVDSAKTVYIQLTQNFGSGGSAAVTTSAGTQALTTSWVRYSFTVAVPSISGKTVGTSSNLALEIGIAPTTGNITLDLWGVQVEESSVVTAFQTATGTLQGELAACQRYYIRSTPTTAYAGYGTGMSGSSTSSYVYIPFPVSLRLQPQAVDYSTLAISDGYAYVLAISNLALNHSTPTMAALMATHAAGATTARTALICNNNSTSGYIGFTAEF
jgi:hypothetical protein